MRSRKLFRFFSALFPPGKPAEFPLFRRPFKGAETEKFFRQRNAIFGNALRPRPRGAFTT